jgi:hypothetical protein
VLSAAEKEFHLIGEVIDEKLEGMDMEPIYSFKFRS